MKGYIYIIENLENGKKYVGQTINIEHRLKEHFSSLEKGKHHSIKLQKAYEKYGKEKFKTTFQMFEVSSLEELLNLEIKYIKECDSFNNGYNMTYGGEGCKTACSYEDSILIYQIGNRYDGVGRMIARYFECDHTVIQDIFNNSTYATEDYDEDELKNLINQIGLPEDNLKENYKKHNEKKLDYTSVSKILSVNEFNAGFLRLTADVFKVHQKAVSRLIKGETYKDFYNQYYSLPESQRKKLSEATIEEYDLNHQRLMRKRNNPNALSQEQVNFILDHKDSLSKAAIGRALGVSADRVGGVINGKSYKDLVEIYYKNKSCRE